MLLNGVLFAIFIIINSIKYSNSSVVSGLYCKDPDTNKFYPIGTKWPSTTFCGTYTCTLKKRNMTTNLSDRNEPKNVAPQAYNIANTEVNAGSDSESSTPELLGIINTESSPEKEDSLVDSIIKAGKDRYLNPDEIMAITKVLHTLRKSELESLLQLYNLAQDIYKDIDKETFKAVPRRPNPTQTYNAINPYWYIHKRDRDLIYNQNVASGQYYQPTPTHQGIQYRKENKIFYKDCPAKPKFRGPWSLKTVVGPWVNRKVRKPYKFNAPEQNQQQYYHYPYSFLFNHNVTYPSEMYYHDKTWTNSNPNKIKEEPTTKILTKKNVEPRVSEEHTEPEIVSAVPWKTDALSDQVLDEVKANWPKNSYSENFINTLLEKSSLWKPEMEKLEKVGTVIRVDDLMRRKRDLELSEDVKDNNGEEFHVHYVAHRCDTADEMGFFRMGNKSEPFPRCCPQKISERK